MAVYFIRAGEDGPVKIGHAMRPNRRLAMLQTGNAQPLRFIRLIEGGRKEEARAHQQFAASRLYGEWFTFCEDMLAFGSEIAAAELPARRRRRIGFHPIVEELISGGQYSHQAVHQWRRRGVPYRVCCRALSIAMERGLIADAAIDLAPFRSPVPSIPAELRSAA